MPFTIERIHNSLEKQQTENRNLLVVIGGKDWMVISPVEQIPTAVYLFVYHIPDQNNEDDIYGL
ncbi:hypothetical protein SDC9_145252 [bioreactor metagenome]|uniref:Uncharacterized protein n=1 Tax=bioreactor metagenome TaxID=1076179 RepID=A0A645E9G2_9ZZZZ